MSNPIKNALISVSNKNGLIPFAQRLNACGIQIYSSGGTAEHLKQQGIAVVEIADYTQSAEMMSGRVKTLHPKVHGGILARRGVDDAEVAKHSIVQFDLVVVNLYPFVNTVNAAQSEANIIENIDIGGPTLIRAAAKNFANVTVVVDENDYASIADNIEHNGNTDLALRKQLAYKAFNHTACYDYAIQNYFAKSQSQPFPDHLLLQFDKVQVLRYGENPHQNAAFYKNSNAQNQQLTIANCEQLQGKDLSYNNIADADAAINCLSQFSGPTCVIIKHANPCGVATSLTEQPIADLYIKAYLTDAESAFGGIIAVNRTIDADLANSILSRQFLEILIAPNATEEAKTILQKKPSIRVLLSNNPIVHSNPDLHLKSVRGGLLLQNFDDKLVNTDNLEIVSHKQPTQKQIQDLEFAWQIVKCVKSNAIVYAKDLSIIGIGAGQTSRVNSVRIAAQKAEQAQLSIAGAAMASDAFFPFRDNIDLAYQYGVRSIIQPGGSMRDPEVIDAVNALGMVMVFTKVRHFYH